MGDTRTDIYKTSKVCPDCGFAVDRTVTTVDTDFPHEPIVALQCGRCTWSQAVSG